MHLPGDVNGTHKRVSLIFRTLGPLVGGLFLAACGLDIGGSLQPGGPDLRQTEDASPGTDGGALPISFDASPEAQAICADNADGTPCTSGGVCYAHACQAGCFIGGVFYVPDQVSSDNPCNVCRPQSSTTTWTVRGATESCGTNSRCIGSQCTVGCPSGASFVPVGGKNPQNECQTCGANGGTFANVADGTTVCSDVTKACFSGACENFCLAGATLVENGQLSPTNSCQRCGPVVGSLVFAFASVANGASCGTNKFCESGACCTAAGAGCTSGSVCCQSGDAGVAGAVCRNDNKCGACTPKDGDCNGNKDCCSGLKCQPGDDGKKICQ